MEKTAGTKRAHEDDEVDQVLEPKKKEARVDSPTSASPSPSSSSAHLFVLRYEFMCAIYTWDEDSTPHGAELAAAVKKAYDAEFLAELVEFLSNKDTLDEAIPTGIKRSVLPIVEKVKSSLELRGKWIYHGDFGDNRASRRVKGPWKESWFATADF